MWCLCSTWGDCEPSTANVNESWVRKLDHGRHSTCRGLGASTPPKIPILGTSVSYKVRGCGVRPSESASWRLGELAPFVWGLLTLCNGQCNAVRNLQTSNHLQMPAGYANRHSDFKKGL